MKAPLREFGDCQGDMQHPTKTTRMRVPEHPFRWIILFVNYDTIKMGPYSQTHPFGKERYLFGPWNWAKHIATVPTHVQTIFSQPFFNEKYDNETQKVLITCNTVIHFNGLLNKKCLVFRHISGTQIPNILIGVSALVTDLKVQIKLAKFW